MSNKRSVPRSFAQVMDLWPATRVFAQDIGVPLNSAHVMRHRNSIAARYWPAMVVAAKRRSIPHVTLELLVALAHKERMVS
jgi:hypothetical protein